MAIDILIKQKLFGKKTMPLEVILGEDLYYGDLVGEQLNEGELGESDFIAYNPQCIGRGFSVIWNPKEKKSIALRLPQPSTTNELSDLYSAVERMVKYWDAKLIVDGNKMSLESFKSSFHDMIDYNFKVIKQFSQQVLDGEYDTLTAFSAMWPLAIGKEEATMFLNDPSSFGRWLHEKQSMDVYFASPDFFEGDNGILARYILTNDLPAILPYQPIVPFGITDPSTGKPLECENWKILIGIKGDKAPLCEMEYSKFIGILPEDKKVKYDGNRFLLSELTEDEIRTMAGM